jgi:hypothetical protein
LLWRSDWLKEARSRRTTGAEQSIHQLIQIVGISASVYFRCHGLQQAVIRANPVLFDE